MLLSYSLGGAITSPGTIEQLGEPRAQLGIYKSVSTSTSIYTSMIYTITSTIKKHAAPQIQTHASKIQYTADTPIQAPTIQLQPITHKYTTPQDIQTPQH